VDAETRPGLWVMLTSRRRDLARRRGLVAGGLGVEDPIAFGFSCRVFFVNLHILNKL
jgi:hypothetical protein